MKVVESRDHVREQLVDLWQCFSHTECASELVAILYGKNRGAEYGAVQSNPKRMRAEASLPVLFTLVLKGGTMQAIVVPRQILAVKMNELSCNVGCWERRKFRIYTSGWT